MRLCERQRPINFAEAPGLFAEGQRLEWSRIPGFRHAGRRLLHGQREEPQRFDVLVLDAFSGDAIPTHLLTRECGDLYMKHLNEDGILAIHITNRHVDLKPVCNGLAKEFGLATQSVISDKNSEMGTSQAHWVLLSRSEATLKKIDFGHSATAPLGDSEILWTDNFSNLLSVMAN